MAPCPRTVALYRRRNRVHSHEATAAVSGSRSSGLVGMRERVALLGGTLSIESEPGGGTWLTAELPLDET